MVKTGQRRSWCGQKYTVGKRDDNGWQIVWDGKGPGYLRFTDRELEVDELISDIAAADPAISPAHYKGNCSFEAIDVVEGFGLNYRLGNVIKYVLRADKKGKPVQDLKKAVWYLQREIAKREDGK